MALDALHMHPTVPIRSQELRNAAGVVFISLVPHGRERGIDLASPRAHHVEADLLQAIAQVLGQRASLQSYLMERLAERPKTANEVRNVRWDGPLKSDHSILVSDADRH